jgi:hypothetical protein
MSLLPPAMQIKDDMPMNLGQAVKRALDPKTKVEDIRKFEADDHQPDGTVRPPHEAMVLRRLVEDTKHAKVYDYAKTYRREPTVAEMPEALLLRALRDAEQAVFDNWLARVCPSGEVEQVHSQWLASDDYLDFLEGIGKEADR